MNNLGEHVENDPELNDVHYEHTIVASKAILSKLEIFILTVLTSFMYFGCYHNDIVVGNKQKIICFIFYLAFSLRVLSRIFWGVKSESIFIVKSLGLQKTTAYQSNFKASVFIPWHSINDVIINEAIVTQRVIFYLAVLVKGENSTKGESIIPLFIHSQPRLSELKKIYRRIQLILKE